MKCIRVGRSVILLLGLVAACASILACTVTPHITSASLGTIVQASRVTDPKTTFAPTDRMIHLVVAVDNVVQNTNVGAKWYAVDGDKRLLFESSTALDAFNTTADFALTNTNDWIPGAYQVVIYLNGAEDRTLNFQISNS